MAVSDAQKKASIEYAKKNLKRIPLDVQKEKYEEIKISAEENGEKVNSYIKAAIDEKMSQIVIRLKKSINTNNELQKELENLLLKNDATMTGFSKEYHSNGSAQLILKFKTKNHVSQQVIDTFKEVLCKFDAL